MHDPLASEGLRPRVQQCIDDELRTQADVLAEVGPDVKDLLRAIESLLAGGKRLRAAFLYWGYRASGQPDSDAAIRLATSMEFFQAAALIHDDVMDDSDTRRGVPAAHRALAADHVGRGWLGDADRFGLAGAILAGNLCLNWTEELYSTSGIPADHLIRGRALFDRMRTQLMAGQFLDVVESMRPWDEVGDQERIERADRVIRYKSAKYTVEHPLLIGATAGGATESDLHALSRFGLDLGHAFQLRDDILGVFGDPSTTGKPAGDDLREGKRTVLIGHTLAALDPATQARVEQLLDDPGLTTSQVEWLREVITASGAIEAVEAEISRLAGTARSALWTTRGLEPRAVGVLDELVDTATARAS